MQKSKVKISNDPKDKNVILYLMHVFRILKNWYEDNHCLTIVNFAINMLNTLSKLILIF